jgi:hypothetical protein
MQGNEVTAMKDTDHWDSQMFSRGQLLDVEDAIAQPGT